MISQPHVIDESSISRAWGRAFCAVMTPGRGSITPLVVTIRDLDDDHLTEEALNEVPRIRRALDKALRQVNPMLNCETVAETIFPWSMWNPEREREALFQRYLRIWPKVQRCQPNRNGVYFHRLISYPGDEPVNQLEHVISTFRNGNHRPTALQAAIFYPQEDHVNTPRRGFPCLHQVAFSYHRDHEGLSVTGFYGNQYIFDRAYGNYLGLFRLGKFMAHEMGLNLLQVTCVASKAQFGSPNKTSLRSLHQLVREHVSGQTNLTDLMEGDQ